MEFVNIVNHYKMSMMVGGRCISNGSVGKLKMWRRKSIVRKTAEWVELLMKAISDKIIVKHVYVIIVCNIRFVIAMRLVLRGMLELTLTIV